MCFWGAQMVLIYRTLKSPQAAQVAYNFNEIAITINDEL